MKTTFEGGPSFHKRPYTVIYPCCSVMQKGLETTPCWVCGQATGRSFNDIPMHHRDLMDLHRQYRQGTSTTFTQFSNVKMECLKWPHP